MIVDRRPTHEGPCPSPAEVTSFSDLANGQRYWVCGCGFCPQPDPTPAELQQRVDDAAWHAAASVE